MKQKDPSNKARLLTQIIREPIQVGRLLDWVQSPSSGAVSLFLGTVRNHAEGRSVSGMEYHGYPEMAEKILEEIARQASQQWEVERIAVVHRLGNLAIGDVSVVIAVSAPHRDAAFAACRFIIEEIKKDLPIWKKEHFLDGQVEWKNDPTK